MLFFQKFCPNVHAVLQQSANLSTSAGVIKVPPFMFNKINTASQRNLSIWICSPTQRNMWRNSTGTSLLLSSYMLERKSNVCGCHFFHLMQVRLDTKTVRNISVVKFVERLNHLLESSLPHQPLVQILKISYWVAVSYFSKTFRNGVARVVIPLLG